MKKLLICAFILFVGCGRESPYQFESQIVVFSVLIADRPNPTIILERSWEIDKKLPEEGLGVDDAEVSVSTVESTIEYTNIKGESGFWAPLDSFMVYPAKAYYLDVIVSGEEEIYSETTVPDTFSIVQPAEGDTLDKWGHLPEIVWQRSQNAAGYLVDISSRVDTTHFSGTVGVADSIFPLLSLFLGESGWHVIKVAALDNNYHDYCKEEYGEWGAEGDEETTRVQGGLGVFGSCVVESVQVYVK